MKYGTYCTGKSILWQQLEGRKRRYAVLEANGFAVNVDYDLIFKQIDKELCDEFCVATKTNPDFEITP